MFGNDKDADCPLWRAPCKGAQCRWHIQVIGNNPNTGEPMNDSGCAVQFLPTLLIQTAKETNHAAASIDRFNDDMVRMNGVVTLQQKILEGGEERPLIEN